MRRPPDHHPPMGTPPELPAALVDYANQLLLGTGLQAGEALLIANGELDPPTQLSGLAHALRSGWELSEVPK